MIAGIGPWFTPGRSARAGWIAMALACPFLPSMAAAQAGDPLVEVAEAAWTDEVAVDRTVVKTYRDTAPLAPLALWIRVVGSQEALQALEMEGKLPIYHKWFVKRIFGTEAAGIEATAGVADEARGAQTLIDNIPIPSGKKVLLPSLWTEVRARGFFDWRTWSKKENIYPGRWRVRIVFADNSPVPCAPNHDACEFEITVAK